VVIGVPSGAVFSSATIRSGCVAPGSGFRSKERIQLKIVVFAPMPTAMVRMAKIATLGVFLAVRKAFLNSLNSPFIAAPSYS
jgi:hypothetical protein